MRDDDCDGGPGLVLFGTDLWVGPRRGDGSQRIGLTVRAQALSGLPKFVSFDAVLGAVLAAGDVLMKVETDKWVGRVEVPFGCRVSALNDGLMEEPTLLKKDPYGEGWLAELFIDGKDMRDLLKNGQARRASPATRGIAELKTSGGLIRAEVVMDGGVISCVRLTGDFHMFPIEAIDAVERSVIGLAPEVGKVKPTVFAMYERRRIESPGMSPTDLANVIIEAAGAAARSCGDKVL